MRSLYSRLFGALAGVIGVAFGIMSMAALAIAAVLAPVAGMVRASFAALLRSRPS
jgi:hypothetical protein